MQGWFYATIAAKYTAGLALLVAGFWFKPAWLVLALAVALFVVSQARRGSGRIPADEAIFLVPPLKVAYDTAYLWGYVRGRMGPRRGSRPLPREPAQRP